MSCPLETWYADDLVAVQASIDEIRTEGTRRLRETVRNGLLASLFLAGVQGEKKRRVALV